MTTGFEPYPTHSSERREWIRRHLGEIPWPDAPLAEKEAWRNLYGLSNSMAANAMKDAAAIRFEAKYELRSGSVNGRPHGEPMREAASGVPSQEETITITSPPPSPPEPSETNANYSDDPYPRGVKGGGNTLESYLARRDWIERHRSELEELAASRNGVEAYAKRYGIPLGSIAQILDRVASEKDGLGAGHDRQARPSDRKPRSDEVAQSQPAALHEEPQPHVTSTAPIESADELTGGFPEDQDFDSFLEAATRDELPYVTAEERAEVELWIARLQQQIERAMEQMAAVEAKAGRYQRQPVDGDSRLLGFVTLLLRRLGEQHKHSDISLADSMRAVGRALGDLEIVEASGVPEAL